ncbi:MAG: 50S ribosomal protein L24 [uncultured bacterium]|nr:MAG: 50S ribosomal protein L24 [uncultured bacterium]
MNIKKNDKVQIIKGNDSGKTGKVEKVFISKNTLIVAGANVRKKHLKKSQKNPYGGIIDINMPINRANVILICPRCDKTTRIKYSIVNKNKLRICKKCGETVDSTK